MEYISSRNIFLLIRDTCKLIDRRPMDHGSRTGYIMYKILTHMGGYEKYELADFLMVASLHDIGAYYTSEMKDRLEYEFRNYLPHSVYGYLFLKFMSPLGDKAKMVLYHRVPCTQLENAKFNYKKETEILKLAEAVDVYHQVLGDKFDPEMFRAQEGTVYTKEALDYLTRAVSKDDIFEHIRDESYQEELADLLKYMIFPNEEKSAFMETLMYCLGLKNINCVRNSICAVGLAEGIGKRIGLAEEELDRLYYGALLHDIGMLSLPAKILNPSLKLTPDARKLIETHIEREKKILSDRMDPEVVRIAVSHHERLDGSGYPLGITEKQMNLPEMILQVADLVTELSAAGVESKGKSKEEIEEILREEVEAGRLKESVVNVLLSRYDEIWEEAKERIHKVVTLDRVMKEKFELIRQSLS